MLIAIDLALAARCSRCATLVPVGGLREQILCHACAAPLDVIAALDAAVPPHGVRALFDDQDLLLAALLANPNDELYASRTGGVARGDTAFVAATRVEPACHACARAFALTEPRTAELACPCGERRPLRWPDASTRGWDTRLRAVLGEHEAEMPKLSQSGIVVPCGGCGAPLSGAVTGRSVVCEHCGTSNLLPDSIFLRLVPDATPRPFTLLYDVDDPLLAKVLAHTDPDAARWRSNRRYAELQKRVDAAHLERALHGDAAIDVETARALAARDLTPAEAKHVDTWLSDVERGKLVGGRIAQTLIDLWATSPDAGTRAIAARIANTERFARDPDAGARAVIAARKHLPAAVIEALAKDGEGAVRAAIAARHDVPIEILKQLRRDGDPEVAAAAKANARYRPGLFTRLFGG